MVNHKNSIPEARQIEIISSMMKLSEYLASTRSYEGIEELSYLATRLNIHLTNDYVSFFDLGEYFFDMSNSSNNQDEWAKQARQRIFDSIDTYRQSRSNSD